MNKLKYIMIIIVIGGLFGFSFFYFQNTEVDSLTREKIYDKIIEQRDYAINQAVLAGDYRCCINPPCTMCYMEANQWNNFTAGTCACDDLIARGEEACPQCQRGLSDIHNEDSTFCSIESTITTCSSTKSIK